MYARGLLCAVSAEQLASSADSRLRNSNPSSVKRERGRPEHTGPPSLSLYARWRTAMARAVPAPSLGSCAGLSRCTTPARRSGMAPGPPDAAGDASQSSLRGIAGEFGAQRRRTPVRGLAIPHRVGLENRQGVARTRRCATPIHMSYGWLPRSWLQSCERASGSAQRDKTVAKTALFVSPTLTLRPTGLEPVTSGAAVRRSNPLSYGRAAAGRLLRPPSSERVSPAWRL